ncbi:MAG: hypothetical protein HY554_06440 [Elusimicrobia bacterium]|nr:hypothetical protein [Elusimicrobiota bacterium]
MARTAAFSSIGAALLLIAAAAEAANPFPRRGDPEVLPAEAALGAVGAPIGRAPAAPTRSSLVFVRAPAEALTASGPTELAPIPELRGGAGSPARAVPEASQAFGLGVRDSLRDAVLDPTQTLGPRAARLLRLFVTPKTGSRRPAAAP